MIGVSELSRGWHKHDVTEPTSDLEMDAESVFYSDERLVAAWPSLSIDGINLFSIHEK